jgi:tetratricopeptide (TPR) repeat protein
MNINEALQSALKRQRAGDVQQAANIYIEVLKVQPDNIDALFMLGTLFAQGGHYDYAIDCFQEAVRIKPDHTWAYYNLGNVCRDKGLTDEALACYQKVLQLDPDYAEAHINSGILFKIKGKYDEALKSYQRAIQLNPQSAEAYYNLGHFHMDKGRFDEALACFQKVIQLVPNNIDAYMNLGLLYRIKGLPYEALKCYQRAIELKPTDAEAHWNMSNVLLLTGDFRGGWEEYEWLWKTKDHVGRQRTYSQPLWDGSDIAGKKILLYAEYGFGDTLQYIRYASYVRKRHGTVIVECQKELTSLLRNVEGVCKVVAQGELLPEFDMCFPLMRLPVVFNTSMENMPARIPYINADSALVERWKHKIGDSGSQVKIGLAWSGGGLPLKKSCSLEIFAPLAGLKRITFYSLQKGEPGKQAMNPPASMKIIDYTDEINEFSDTAALIENLDLVISVDTSVAHLAGALGKPVWVLLPFVPDWRWFLDREDSPWYPTMRLFRQSSLGEWSTVINRIAQELNKLRNLTNNSF